MKFNKIMFKRYCTQYGQKRFIAILSAVTSVLLPFPANYTYRPAHEILVLMALSSHEGSGESAHSADLPEP